MDIEKNDSRTAVADGEETVLLPEGYGGEALFPENEETAEEVVMPEENESAANETAEKQPEKVPGDENDAPQERNFREELTELLAQRPDLVEKIAEGEGLPREVISESLKNGASLRAAYAEYEAKQEKSEAERMRRENEILKQNAAAAAKAPVKGTAAGGSTEIHGKDPFLEGFLSEE